MLHFCSILYSFWHHSGSLWPLLGGLGRVARNVHKILDFGTRLHFDVILASFCAHFGSILASFWLHFGDVLAPFGSLPFCLDFGSLFSSFLSSRVSHLETILAQKTIKNRSLFLLVFRCIFHWFWKPKRIPKPSQKASKNQTKNQSKNRHVFSWISHWFRYDFLRFFLQFSNRF